MAVCYNDFLSSLLNPTWCVSFEQQQHLVLAEYALAGGIAAMAVALVLFIRHRRKH